MPHIVTPVRLISMSKSMHEPIFSKVVGAAPLGQNFQTPKTPIPGVLPEFLHVAVFGLMCTLVWCALPPFWLNSLDGKNYSKFQVSIKPLRFKLETHLFPRNSLPAPHCTTRMRIITGNYRPASTHYRQITGIYMGFTIKDVQLYQRFTDKVGLFTADYRR